MNKPVEWTPTVRGEEEEHAYSQGGIPPGCTAGLPSGISLASYTPLYLLLRQGRPERSFRLCSIHCTFIWLGLTRCTVEFRHVGHWANR
jgi:hypothetical protein